MLCGQGICRFRQPRRSGLSRSYVPQRAIRDSQPQIVQLGGDFLPPRVPFRPERWMVTVTLRVLWLRPAGRRAVSLCRCRSPLIHLLDPSTSRSPGTGTGAAVFHHPAHSQLRQWGYGAQRQVRVRRRWMRTSSRGSIPERTRTPWPAGTPCPRRRY